MQLVHGELVMAGEVSFNAYKGLVPISPNTTPMAPIANRVVPCGACGCWSELALVVAAETLDMLDMVPESSAAR